MKLFDLKAGMTPRRVRIFLAEKGIDIPRVEIDRQARENRKPERGYQDVTQRPSARA